MRHESYLDNFMTGANQCYYYINSPRSFHGIAKGDYSINWYKGSRCEGKAVATTKDGKYIKESKWKGPLSFKISHKKDSGPFERQVSCAQKGVGGKNYDSLQEQINYSKTVCAAAQEKCSSQKNTPKKKEIPCPRYMYSFNKVTDRGDDCRINNPEMQKWYDAECRKRKGYTCQRRVRDGKDKTKLVPCNKAIDFMPPLG
jgi:hypothetical protein